MTCAPCCASERSWDVLGAGRGAARPGARDERACEALAAGSLTDGDTLRVDTRPGAPALTRDGVLVALLDADELLLTPGAFTAAELDLLHAHPFWSHVTGPMLKLRELAARPDNNL